MGTLDIAAGLSLLWPNTLALYLGIAMLLKGLISLASAVGHFWLDWAGWIDLAAGLCLIFGWSLPLLWLLPLAKGAWSVAIGIMR